MTKTYCDRCGKEIQGSKYALIRHRILYAKQRLIPSYMRDSWKDTDKCICPDCEEQYIHWFMNPEPPNESRTTEGGNMSNIHAVDQEDVAEIMNRINEALVDTQYEAVGSDNTGFFLTVIFDRKVFNGYEIKSKEEET